MDKMRKEFEKWAKSEGICLANWYNPGQYADTRARYSWQAWQAWQASRAALVVDLPKVESGHFIEDISLAKGFEDGQEAILDLVKMSLKNAGIKHE